jgi:hypothetical protein
MEYWNGKWELNIGMAYWEWDNGDGIMGWNIGDGK